MKKVCNICREEKELCDFGMYNRRNKIRVENRCKQCENERRNKYNIEHKENVKLRDKEYRIKNKEKLGSLTKKYYEINRDIILLKVSNKRRTDEERKKRNEYKRNRRLKDPIYKLTDNVRARLTDYLKTTGITKSKRTFDIVGCSPPELKEHISNQFIDGMSWDNYGYYGWHIDHITPLSSAKTEEEIYKLAHYTNLQPLWAEDNLSKGDRY